MKKVSIKDLAAITGTSATTVSFVLNGKAKEMRISAAITKKILAAAKKHGYKPNQIAVSLRTGQSKIIGIIVESIGGVFFGALAKVIEAEADKYGYRIVYCSTENNLQKAKAMIQMLAYQQVDGYIITPTSGMEKDIRELIESKKPVVLMDGYFPGIDVPHVLVDNYDGVKQGIAKLAGMGYQKIGFITVDLDLIQIKERLRGYKETLKQHQLKADGKWILKLGYDLSKEDALKAISRYLKDHPELEAVFFATNYLGIRGLQAIVAAGLQIPGDLAVLSFDEHEIFDLYPPGITSIQQPIEAIAQTAMHLLLTGLGKKAEPLDKDKIELPPTLIERGSTFVNRSKTINSKNK